MINVNEALLPEPQQFMAALKAEGWSDAELRNLGRLWNVAEADIAAVAGKTHKDPLITEIRTAIIAAQVSHAITVRCRPSTPAIVNASPEQLLEFTDFYEAELDRIYRDLVEAQTSHPTGATVGNPERDALCSQFARLAGFLWECQEVSGVNGVLITPIGTPA